MNKLVKILSNEDGEKQHNPKWHLVQFTGGSNASVCTSEVYGHGEGDAIYKEKESEKGITCPQCKAIVQWFKKVKI